MLILASQSPFRKAQLENLGLTFISQSPKFDEEAHKDNNIPLGELCVDLGYGKAKSLISEYPDHIIIGSDQLVDFNGTRLDKPKTFENTVNQITMLSGNTHKLLTSICVIYKEKVFKNLITTTVKLKKISHETILKYVEKEKPYDCVGGIMIEKGGPLLIDEIYSEDLTCIQGLPLITLAKILDEIGYDPFT